jgi:16S rRNA (cytidine1402-2'-O)-methyltransferase
MLYVVGMPVGNWADMPPRNLNIIKKVKYIIAENEDIFKEIFSKFEVEVNAEIKYIATQGNGKAVIPTEQTLLPWLSELLSGGEDVCLISDDGMPGVADPGQTIINWCHDNGFKVSATPGPSALTAAVTVSGCGHKFRFHSFFETDKDRRLIQIKNIKDSSAAEVFMLRNSIGFGEDAFVREIEEVLPEIIQICGDKRATLCYNLTMDNEMIVRGKISYLLDYHMKHRDVKQHIILVIEGFRPNHQRQSTLKDQ